MSLKTAILLAGFSALVGIAFGYFLRWIISLGKKGSVELEIKQMILEAKDEAQKIVTEAEDKAEVAQKELRSETKQKEGELKKTEERLVKKEEFLDSRQRDTDKEAEELKGKIVEVKAIKDKVEKMEADKLSEFEKISQLTQKEARDELLKSIERDNAEDIAVRMQKLDVQGEERLEKKLRKF